MFDVFIDTLLDCLKLIPFLLVAFIIIELFEHKLSNKLLKLVSKSGKFGPLLGSTFGIFPQCGFSVLATNLYITRIISLGTLISIYLSTSDEMLPILISNKVEPSIIIKILLIKFIVGIIFGFIIDLAYQKKNKYNYHICDDDHCDCENGIIYSTLKHTFKTIIYIFIATFIINTFIYIVGIDTLSNLLLHNSLLSPFISSLIGLIPNCSSSVIITELYINNIINLGTCISGLLTNSGLALLILFKSNKDIKENITILSLIYFIGVIVGLIINII